MNKIFTILLIGIITGAFAQQIPVNDQYYTNPFFTNPAKAGSNGGTNAFLFNRQQWTNIQGSPQTSLFSIDGAINKTAGLGLTISNDQDNIFSRTSAYGTYSYRIKITENQNITLGASAGLMNVHIAFDDINADNSDDPLLLSTDANKTNFDVNFGLNYTFKRFEFGAVAYQLAGTRFNYKVETAGKEIDYQLIQHFMGVVNYTFDIIKDTLTITPSVMLRSSLGITPQLDAGVMLKYKDFVWTNIGWRQNSCVYASVGGVVYNNIIVGGAYEYNLGSISGFSGSSFEVILGYRFGKGRTQTSIGSNYSKSDIKQLRRIAQQQSEEMDKLKNKNQELNKEIVKNNKEILEMKEEITRLKNWSELTPEDQKVVEEFKKEHEVKSFELSSSEVNNSFKSNKYCVIAGAYKNLKNAKLGQKILKRELNLQTFIIKKPNSKFYFVATDFFDNTKDIKKEHERLKKMGIDKLINGATWVYKVK